MVGNALWLYDAFSEVRANSSQAIDRAKGR